MMAFFSLFYKKITWNYGGYSPRCSSGAYGFTFAIFPEKNESAIASTSVIFVSWSSNMFGLSDLIISFIASTLLKPPRPLQFQEVVFNIYLMIEILLGIYHLFLPLLYF